MFYGMFIPMFVAFALFLRGQKLWRIVSMGGIILLAGGALFTYSRQSYFLALLGSTLLLVRRSLIVAILLGVTLVSLAGYLPDAVTQRVEETKQQDKHGGEEVDVSTASRWEIWEGAMSMLKEHPLGVGLNRFKANIGNYCKYKGMDAHNFYVLTLAETSLPGLLTLVALWMALFRLASFLRTSARIDDPESLALALGFTVTTVCMMLGGLYGSPHFEGSVMGDYWALCGLLERYAYLKRIEDGQTPTGPVEESLSARFPLAVHLS